MLVVLANPRRPGRPTPPDVVVPPGGSIWTDDIVAALAPYKWWRMNEASGSVAANSGSSADAGAAIINPAPLERGLPPLVLEDDGGGSFGWPGLVTNPPYLSDADPIVVGASFTLFVMVQLDAYTGQCVFMTLAQPAATNGAWSFEARNDGSGTAMRPYTFTGVGGAPSVLAGGANSMPIGQPVGVAFVQKSDASTGGRWLYVDGVEVASNTAVKEFTASPAVTGYISSWSGGSAPFNGLMAEAMTFNRALSAAEIATLSRARGQVIHLGDWSAAVDESASGSFDPTPYAHPEIGFTTPGGVVTEGPIVNLTGSGTVFNYTTGAVTSQQVEPQTVRLTYGAVQSNVATLTVTVRETGTGGGGAGAFTCAGSINLGSSSGKSLTNLDVGGTNASYRADGLIKFAEWSGQKNPDSTYQLTGNQYFFRLPVAHTGGCVRGGRIYSNLTKNEDYGDGDIGVKLYPGGRFETSTDGSNGDGGQFYYGNNRNVTNFTVEGFRFHGCWDPIRTPGREQSGTTIAGWKVLNCWATCVRDDFVENDGKNPGSIIGCLVGDVINSTSWRVGCFHFFSAKSNNLTFPDSPVIMEDNLVWSSSIRDTDQDTYNFNGYQVGQPLKMSSHEGGPVLKLYNNTFLIDHECMGGGGGDPLRAIKNNNAAQPGFESEGNVVIWRDTLNHGSYSSFSGWTPVPPGFTVLQGSEGEQEWNLRVNNWKAANSHVPRFRSGDAGTGANNTVNRAGAYQNKPAGTGASFNLVDVG